MQRSAMHGRVPAALAIAIAIATSLAGCPGRIDRPERFGLGGGARDGGAPRGDGGAPGGDGGGSSRADGGGGSADDGGGGSAIDVPALLAAECAGSGCHGATSPALGLDLASAGVGARVAGIAAASCSGRVLADPGDPDASFLLEKVSAVAPACGSRMPLGRAALDAAEIAALRGWIEGL